MNIFDFLQLLGGIILAIGYFPQIKQILETESCKDINLKTYILLCLGIGLMEIYAVNQWMHGMAMMFCVTNTLSLILVGYIIALILAFRNGKDIQEALFLSKYSDGSEIITPCKVNHKTKEITDIVASSSTPSGHLVEECLLIGSDEYPACSEDDREDDEYYWY